MIHPYRLQTKQFLKYLQHKKLQYQNQAFNLRSLVKEQWHAKY